ncbi:MAG: hypothetical protein ABI128_04530 [Rhodanobacter sp.]
MKNIPPSPSRRAWLKAAAVALAVAPLPVIALDGGKVEKAVAHYQEHPDAGKMCSMCRFFVARCGTSPGKGMMGSGGMKGSGSMMGSDSMMGSGGMMHSGGMMGGGSCQLVAGSISPMGYCQLYQPLRKK